jgi:hypothetical protein
MIDYSEALELTDLSKLDKEIAERRDLLERMGGNIYPPLVRAQVIELVKRRNEIEHLCELNKEYLLKKWKI